MRAIKDGQYSAYSTETSITVIGIMSVTITSPGENAVVKPGSAVPITWTVNRVDNIKIEYSANEGLTFEAITQTGGISPGDNNWGNYMWQVPDADNTTVVLRVSEYSDLCKDEVTVAISSSGLQSARSGIRQIPVMPDGAYAVFDTRGRKIVSVSGRELLTGKRGKTVLTGVHVVRMESREGVGRIKKVLGQKQHACRK